MTPLRPRLLYAFLIAATIIVGLSARRFASHFPPFVADTVPDALWATMVFWIVGFLFPKEHTPRVAAAALLFCYVIEVSQLYHAPWIDATRRTTLGRLVLGFTFAWGDLASYTVGVLAGAVFERVRHARGRG